MICGDVARTDIVASSQRRVTVVCSRCRRRPTARTATRRSTAAVAGATTARRRAARPRPRRAAWATTSVAQPCSARTRARATAPLGAHAPGSYSLWWFVDSQVDVDQSPHTPCPRRRSALGTGSALLERLGAPASALALSIRAAKGLEFDVVLLLDFFTASPVAARDRDAWPNLLLRRDKPGARPPPLELETELKARIEFFVFRLSGVACGGNGGARLCTVRMQLRGSASRKNHACPPVTSLLLSQWCDTRSPL